MRYEKDQLCDDCKELIALGKQAKEEINIEEYVYGSIRWYSIGSYKLKEEQIALTDAITNALKSVEIKSNSVRGYVEITSRSATTSSTSFRIKKTTA